MAMFLQGVLTPSDEGAFGMRIATPPAAAHNDRGFGRVASAEVTLRGVSTNRSLRGSAATVAIRSPRPLGYLRIPTDHFVALGMTGKIGCHCIFRGGSSLPTEKAHI